MHKLHILTPSYPCWGYDLPAKMDQIGGSISWCATDSTYIYLLNTTVPCCWYLKIFRMNRRHGIAQHLFQDSQIDGVSDRDFSLVGLVLLATKHARGGGETTINNLTRAYIYSKAWTFQSRSHTSISQAQNINPRNTAINTIGAQDKTKPTIDHCCSYGGGHNTNTNASTNECFSSFRKTDHALACNISRPYYF